ncbi:MAG: hypothetical protein A3I02_05230 [Betaproteobacteria bacterium RIFCSPLOWO2_02_FULL_67_26]|nr:MAG: hypothetical protein A3I02_05230 [Betaproteobacteria bacterium RIFCSPLOWO2_02_FULL_67_26]
MTPTSFPEEIVKRQALLVEQKHELAEVFGFETRNRYVVSSEDGVAVAYAAEQQKGWSGFLMRQFLGHWRTFDLHFFDLGRKPILVAHHPFRWYFQRLEVSTAEGRSIGALQQRFAVLSKRFDVEDATGTARMTVSSPLWKIWTFPFMKGSKPVAVVAKKWAGLLAEGFTDKDRFRVEYQDPGLSAEERLLVLAAALFVDLQYFERKAR